MDTCFIIMPLTTPDSLASTYGKDADHFVHLTEHLFVPAVKKAGFDPIAPVAKGADVIQAEIIRNLETADLVLCDISTLNPNVFFELGCRTALNKPVCYVMDDLTRAIPFDTGIINHYAYSHTLAPWTLNDEVERLSSHIRLSAERSAGKNMLWKYFGLQSAAHAVKSQGEEQDRLAYLVMQVDAIKKRLEEQLVDASYSTYENRFNVGGLSSQGYEAFYPNSLPYNGQTVTVFPRDWEKEIADSEDVLQQIASLQKRDQRPGNIDAVKSLIEQHLKSLGELIDSEQDTQRAEKARSLQIRFRNLLCKK